MPQKDIGKRLGSDGSAAGGRRSDLSEWQRSTDDDGISMPRRMSGTATGMGSNETGCTMHALAVGPARREMTLDRSVNHSDDQGSFHEVVGFRHLRNLSFCGI